MALQPATSVALLRYLELLQRWNATFNLSAVRDPHAMLRLHVADCLAVVRPLMRQQPAGCILDVGSGGGLPGVVLAALSPSWSVHCIDAVGKKAAFVRQVAAELGLQNLHGVHARVEQWPPAGCDVVVARAFASLADLVALTRRHLRPGGVWMAMKGRRPDSEIQALPSDIEVFHVEPIQVPELDAERCLVWLRMRANDVRPSAAAHGVS